MASSGDSNVTFARALASPDKETRDKTIKSLVSYAKSTEEMSEIEMLKLWKALHYCMWLSDKAPIQMELAKALSGLFLSFKNDIGLLYLRMFFRTMNREWTLLDQHRVDKFYTLLRYMLREILMHLNKNKFDAESVENVLDILEEEVLIKTPNGIRLHIADIFLTELWTATKGKISTDSFLLVLDPFFRAIQGTLDTSFQERVTKQVFEGFLDSFAKENKVKGEEQQLFLSVDTSVLQATIFSLASDTDTIEKNRRRLYLLHKEFPKVTGTPFALEEGGSLQMEEEEEEEEEEMIEIIAANKKITTKEKNKKVNTNEKVDLNIDQKNRTDKVIDKSNEILKRKASEYFDDNAGDNDGYLDEKNEKNRYENVNNGVEDRNEEKRKLKKLKKIEKKSVHESEEKSKSENKTNENENNHKKRKSDNINEKNVKGTVKDDIPVAKRSTIATPEAKVQKTAAETQKAAVIAIAAPFIKEKGFTGSRPGYVFKKGKSGLGYYQDADLMKKQAKMLKKKEGSKPIAIKNKPTTIKG
jgi:ribosomal RNA-processing protein 1